MCENKIETLTLNLHKEKEKSEINWLKKKKC